MTTLKKASTFEVIHYLWVHSRPHTKRMRSRCALGAIGTLVMAAISKGPHFPGWLGLALASIITVFLLRETLIFLAADISWEARRKDEKLGTLLTSPDLHQRFTALRLRLRGSDSEELRRLQDAMEFGARESQRLAEEISKYKDQTIALHEQQDQDRRSAEALAKLLDSQVERVAEMIECKGRRNQWFLLFIGAILGVAVQALAQWIF